MLRILGLLLGVATMLVCLADAGEGAKSLRSGPPAGKSLPGPFDARVVNGEFKGKQHCVICENRLFPMILAFVRHPDSARDVKDDSPIVYLLDKMEEAVERHDLYYLKSAAFFLSPHATSSATTEGKKEAKDLVEEARNREHLLRRLEARGKKYEREKTGEAKPGEKEMPVRYSTVTLAAYPAEGPKGYAIHPDAEVTLIFFNNLKVLANEAYPAGTLTKEEVDRFIGNIDKIIDSWKMAPEGLKKGSPKRESPEK